MENKKEIVILSGGGHKGIVKLQGDLKSNDIIKGSCNLDFRPTNAFLYLVGDNVTKIALYDINTAFEVPFCASNKFGCAMRSSAITMFGGALSNGLILSRIDEYNKDVNQRSKAQINNANKLSGTQTQTIKQSSKPASIKDVAELDEWTKYDGNNFYYVVKPQLDELFICYPQENTLSNAVANSQWVRVESNDDCYVVGIIFDNNEPSLLCYGVPAKSGDRPPSELSGACIWLPVSEEDGYFIIYQSAHTGEIIKN